MDEAEWLACNDPDELVAFLQDRERVSDRKARLFAVACCRRIWHLITDERSRRAVEVAERFADGKATDLEREVADAAANEASKDAYTSVALATCRDVDGSNTYLGNYNSAEATATAAAVCYGSTLAPGDLSVSVSFKGSWETFMAWVARGVVLAVAQATRRVADPVAGCGAATTAETSEKVVQCRLLHCLLGNPFRPLLLAPSWVAWNDGTVAKLAKGIYDDRAFDRLPVLADALEDAGCDNADILSHLRGPGPHVRGCWVVDLLLGKE